MASGRHPALVPNDYLADLPVEDPSGDRFGRWPFAARIADTIAERSGSETLVIGVYGRWGSGKSTVLNFIKKRLETRDDVVYATFNPWLFASTEQLLNEFFSLIAETLTRHLKTPVEKLGDFLSRFGRAASGVSVAAGAGGLDPSALIQGVAGLLGSVDMADMRKRVNAVLRESKKRVVILIDDVDRLDVEETYLLFRLVKLVADFENTTYILAFDEQVVAAALSRRYPEQQRFGEGFVEKIVQMPLHLPPARLDLVHRVIFEGIDELLNREKLTLEIEDVVRFRSAFDDLGLDIATPRAATRYLNAIQFAVPMLKGEVDLVDLLLVEEIRVALPSLYQWVSRNKKLLTEPSLTLSGKSTEDVAALDDSVATLTSAQAVRGRKIVSELFPRAQAVWSPFHVGGVEEEALARAKRLSSSAYFDRYFAYAVPPDDVADAEIMRLVQLADSADPEVNTVLHALTSGDNAQVVITKIRQRRAQIRSEAAERLIVALAAVGPNLDFETRQVFALTSGEEASILIGEVLTLIPQLDQRSEIADAFARAAEPLQFPVETLKWMSGPTGDKSEPALDDAAMNRMRASVAERIVELNARQPLFLAFPEWAARFYLLASESPSRDALEAELRVQVNDVSTAAAFARAFMTRGKNIETGRMSLHAIDTGSYEALVSVLESPHLESLFSSVVDGATSEMASDDMTDADDVAVARNFMRVAEARRGDSEEQHGTTSETEEAAPQGGGDGSADG